MYKVLTEFSRSELLRCAGDTPPSSQWNETRVQAWAAIGPLACVHRELIKRVLIVRNPPEPPRGELHVVLPDSDLWALLQLTSREFEPCVDPAGELLLREGQGERAHPIPDGLSSLLDLEAPAHLRSGPDGQVILPPLEFVALKVDTPSATQFLRALVRGKAGRLLQVELLKTKPLAEEQDRQRFMAFTQTLARALGAFHGRFTAYLDWER